MCQGCLWGIYVLQFLRRNFLSPYYEIWQVPFELEMISVICLVILCSCEIVVVIVLFWFSWFTHLELKVCAAVHVEWVFSVSNYYCYAAYLFICLSVKESLLGILSIHSNQFTHFSGKQWVITICSFWYLNVLALWGLAYAAYKLEFKIISKEKGKVKSLRRMKYQQSVLSNSFLSGNIWLF